MQDFIKLNDREHFRISILKPLIEKGLILLINPEKPNSPNQKHFTAPKES